MIDPLLLSPRTAFPSMGRFQCHHRTRKVGDFHNKLLKYQRVHTNWRLKSSVGRDEMIVSSNYCGKTNQNIPTNGGGLLAQYPLQVKVTTPVSPTCLMDKWWKYMSSELNCIKWLKIWLNTWRIYIYWIYCGTTHFSDHSMMKRWAFPGMLVNPLPFTSAKCPVQGPRWSYSPWTNENSHTNKYN